LGATWGLKYKTAAFVWAKLNRKQGLVERAAGDDKNWFMGMGYYSRSNCEPCLLFTRGKPKRKSKGVRQLIVTPIREHSQKPDLIYERIEALVEGPYLEIFARQRRAGWSAIGNGIDGRDIRQVLQPTQLTFL
ncbi:MAG: MT-A70 family methyltransferase, partial [Chloroflexota bacterium]